MIPAKVVTVKSDEGSYIRSVSVPAPPSTTSSPPLPLIKSSLDVPVIFSERVVPSIIELEANTLKSNALPTAWLDPRFELLKTKLISPLWPKLPAFKFCSASPDIVKTRDDNLPEPLLSRNNSTSFPFCLSVKKPSSNAVFPK